MPAGTRRPRINSHWSFCSTSLPFWQCGVNLTAYPTRDCFASCLHSAVPNGSNARLSLLRLAVVATPVQVYLKVVLTPQALPRALCVSHHQHLHHLRVERLWELAMALNLSHLGTPLNTASRTASQAASQCGCIAGQLQTYGGPNHCSRAGRMQARCSALPVWTIPRLMISPWT